MNPISTVVIIVSKANIELAKSISEKMPNTEVHALNIKEKGVNVTFSKLSEHIGLLQKNKCHIIAICSIGIIVRSLRGNFLQKKMDLQLLFYLQMGSFLFQS